MKDNLHLKVTGSWYCANCGKKLCFTIKSTIPEYFDTNIDKQWIVNVECTCGSISRLYRNRKEVVQIVQSTIPKNKEEEDDSF